MAFFLASNGLLYRDPTLCGDGWLVTFDGEDDPELILAADHLDATRARLRAVSILDGSGLCAMLTGPPRKMMRAYDSDGREVRDSYCFWLVVESPIPAELFTASECAAGVTEPPANAAVVLFGQSIGTV